MASWPYSTRRWQRVRARQLAREPLCRACAARGDTTPAEHVDHITPISAGGAVWDPENLASLCAADHSRKTARDKAGKGGGEDWSLRGCFSDGSPRDPEHPWYSGPPAGEQ